MTAWAERPIDGTCAVAETAPMPNREMLIGAFCAWQAARNFSPRTIIRRRGTLAAFARNIEPTMLPAATPEQVEDFLAPYRQPRTRHAYHSDLRVFYTWARRRGIAPANPVEQVDPVRLPRAVPRPVDVRLVPGIVDAAADPRLRVMVALAAYAGLRRAEIAHLDPGDVGTQMLVVRNGKGGKDRVVPILPALRPILDEAVRAHLLPVGLHVETVGRQIAAHLRACGVNMTAHALRHSYATELARVSRGDLVLIGRLLGHSSPQTSMGYIGWAGSTIDMSAMFPPPGTTNAPDR